MSAPGRMKVHRGGRWSRSNRRRDESARRERLGQTLVVLIGLPVLGLLLFTLLFGEMGLFRFARVSNHHEQLTQDIAAIETENAALSREIANLKHDPLTIETIARERLGMGRQGEIVYRFEDAGPSRR
jgi:cell division protein FtsB